MNTHASLEAVLETACAERNPDAVLATGDLAERPEPATYDLFLATVRPYFSGPLLCVPGNHDDGRLLDAALPTADLELDDWVLAGVDTHVDGEVGGNVSADELERLRGRLAASRASNLLVVGHHCPMTIGCDWLDRHRIDNGDELLFTLLAAGVKAYAFGHIHQPVDANGGLPVLGTPSTCFQFAQGSPTFGIDDSKPGYRWLVLAPDGSVQSRVGRAAGFEFELDLADRPAAK